MTLFSAGIERDSVSLLRFPFHSHVQVFLGQMSAVCIIINYFFFDFLTPALADAFSEEFEYQQFCSSFQDSPQYPDRS